ncbi:GIY-YIG nuclease family protein [Novosphingobium sp. Chol11]|uniref:GIY-YIG nuclease family protein n=1 Tax=Novosphingobium sp. Chol11 TaxID=1385763 RepID=UPI0025F94380|nr:hypothetical protein [Novosphingobium sp. Chol11]
MGKLPDLMSVPRFRRMDCIPSPETGVYALFLNPGSESFGLTPVGDGLIYIGKAEGAQGFADRCHFDGRTINHSPRKSLAVLVSEHLKLDFQGHPPSKWGLTAASDIALSAWMKANLLVTYWPSNEATSLEESLIRAHAPPLNLTICNQGADQARIRRLRSIAKAQALKLAALPIMRKAELSNVIGSIRVRSDDSAPSIAERYGLNPKSFRAALRRQKFAWHDHGASWDVARKSADWNRMIEVAIAMSGRDLGELE